MDLPSLHAMFLTKLPSIDLRNALSTDSGITHTVASDKGAHFTANEIEQ